VTWEEDFIEPEDCEEGDPDFNDDGLEAAMADEEKPLSDTELQSMARRLVELRNKRDQTKKAASDAKKEFEDFQADMLERVKKSPVKGSRNVELGDDMGEIRLTPKSTKYGRILNYDDALKYFEERNKDKEYVREEFRMARLHELVRECIEQKKPLPPGVDFYTKEYFQITFKD
jgi:hypothetical protein